jgi:hypothetical protein
VGGRYAGTVDTGGKFATGATTLVKLVAKFAAGVFDAGGKVATGVVDTGGNFAAGDVDTGGKIATGINLELRISPRIFEKIRNGPNGILRGFGETDS